MNIIQTWKTKNVPAYYHGYINKIKNLHPQWNYMFFDDNAIVDFMKSKMPEYINVFNNLPYTIQKIDFFRYLAIYYYGGVYLDLDMDIFVHMDYISNKHIPTDIYYKGYWDVIFFKPERAEFKLKTT